MAWPLTPYETCTANVTVVHAALATAIQAAINGIIGATYSLRATYVDGTGGNVVAGRAGTGRVSAADSLDSTPTPTVALGEFGRGLVLIGWAVIAAGGTIVRGINVFSVGHSGTGAYEITFNTAPTYRTVGCPMASITSGSDSVIISCNTQDNGGRIQVNVLTGTANAPTSGAVTAFTAADKNHQVLLFAE